MIYKLLRQKGLIYDKTANILIIPEYFCSEKEKIPIISLQNQIEKYFGIYSWINIIIRSEMKYENYLHSK